MTPKEADPVETTTDLTPLVERHPEAEEAAGAVVSKLAARSVYKGHGDHPELRVDLRVDALVDSDVRDVSVDMAFYDESDLLIETMTSNPSNLDINFERVVSRDGRRLYVKYDNPWAPGGILRLARWELNVTRHKKDVEWEPERTPLDVKCIVKPPLQLAVGIDRALVRSGYSDGYNVMIHLRVESAEALHLDELSRLLACEPLPGPVTFDVFLHDEADRLVETYTKDVEAGRTMPFTLHFLHSVGLDVPVAKRAVVVVRGSAEALKR